MPYHIENGEPLDESVRRIAREQIEKAREDLADDDPRRAVHEVRKRCKKLRGLLRLVRRGAEDLYARENACFRDAARELSELRDATSLLECFDRLLDRFGGDAPGDDLREVRDALVARRREIEGKQDLGARLARLDDTLAAARDRVPGWKLQNEGAAVVARSLAKTHGRAARALARARQEPSDGNLHEWRKRVKYNRYHYRLVAPLWPPVVSALRDQAEELSDLLGDDHDLAVLRATVAAEPDRFGPTRRLQKLLGLCDERRLELRTRALPLGARLYADPPKGFRKRWKRTWRAWEQESALARALPAGVAREIPG